MTNERDTDIGTAAVDPLIMLPYCIKENQDYDQGNSKVIKRWKPQKGGHIPSFFFGKPSKDTQLHCATSRGFVSGSLVSSLLILRVLNWHRWCNLGPDHHVIPLALLHWSSPCISK